MGRELTIGKTTLNYITAVTPPEPPLLRQLRAETQALGQVSGMQISWTQARFMQLVAKIIRARRYLEIGVFTGYSSLAMAQSLPASAKILALDVSKEWTDIAKKYWVSGGVAKKIKLILGDARATLQTLEKKKKGTFDLVFIDADKENLLCYYSHALTLLRPGGIVMVDNVLWSGAVYNPKDRRKSTTVLRTFNKKIIKDTRVSYSLVPIGDGLTLAVKN